MGWGGLARLSSLPAPQKALKIFDRPCALADLDHRPHQRANHVAEKRLRLYLHAPSA